MAGFAVSFADADGVVDGADALNAPSAPRFVPPFCAGGGEAAAVTLRGVEWPAKKCDDDDGAHFWTEEDQPCEALLIALFVAPHRYCEYP